MKHIEHIKTTLQNLQENTHYFFGYRDGQLLYHVSSLPFIIQGVYVIAAGWKIFQGNGNIRTVIWES